MTRDQTINILLLIAAISAYITPYETTKKFDKFRKQIRKGIRSLHNTNSVQFKELAISSNDVWEKAKEELNNTDYTISVSISLVTLYGFLDDSPYRDMFFSQKTFTDAIGSLMHTNRKESDGDKEQTHTDSVKLTELFGRLLGITTQTKLSFVKLKMKNNAFLGGRLSA